MKKILVLSSFPASYRVDVFKGLAEKYELTVLFGANANEDRNPAWFVESGELKYYLVSTDEGKRFADECYRHLRDFDLVLGYDWYQTWALKFELKAWLLKIPYIVNCDGAFVPTGFHPKDLVKRFFIRNARACLAGGDYAKRYFLYYGAKEENIHVHHFTSLHEGDILPSVRTAEEKRELKVKLGLPDQTIILSIGQFIYRKGFDILLSAWTQMKREAAHLVILGGGGLRPEYEAFIREKGLGNVTILDFVPFDKIFEYYQASDVFALSTREDIWGLIVNEAMANGIPVLISDRCVAGLELVQSGRNGFIIDNHDVSLWAEKLTELISDDKMREEMGQNALKMIRGNTIEESVLMDIRAIESIL